MSKPYATVLIGFGSVAAEIGKDPRVAQYLRYPSHASVLCEHPRFDWQAVVDPSPEAREIARQEWKVPIVAADIADLPKGFAPDVAVLATRPTVRLSALRALPSLRGALIEKPLAGTFAEGRAVADWCAERGLAVNVNLFRRGEATCRRLSVGALDDLVGDIQTATVLYGNGLRNNGLHMIDVLRMLGADVVAVRALTPMRESRSTVADDGEAAIAIELRSGATVFMHPLDFDSYRDVLIDIWGNRGRLEIFQEGLFLRHSPLREHRAITGPMEVALDAATVEATQCGSAYYEMYSNLADAVEGTAPPFCPPEEALRSEAVVEAAFRSAREGGRSVPLDEVWGSQ